MGMHAVGGLEILCGVEIPEHISPAGVMGSQVTVQRSGEQDSRNQTWRSHLSGAAAILSGTGGLGRGNMPHLFPGEKIEGEDAAADIRIVEIKIGKREVGVPIIGGATPFHTAQRASPA